MGRRQASSGGELVNIAEGAVPVHLRITDWWYDARAGVSNAADRSLLFSFPADTLVSRGERTRRADYQGLAEPDAGAADKYSVALINA